MDNDNRYPTVAPLTMFYYYMNMKNTIEHNFNDILM